MSSEFMPGRYTIGELIKNGTILGHKDGNFGSYYPKITDFGDVGVPLITAKVINNGRINFSEAQKLSFEKANSLPFGFIEENDVLLSHNATVGRVAIVPRLEGRVLIGTSLTYFRVNKERLLPHYLGAFFESRDFQNQLEAVMGLSTRNQVPITAQRLLTIEVPSLAVQTEIANCIQALDNRLNLLRETNATLEAIAQALFKSWFVDFDPVHANAGTQASSLPPEIQALFPATFTDSPQGPIPEGWKLVPFGDLLTHTIGGDWGDELPTEKNEVRVAIIRGTDLPDLAAGNAERVPLRYTNAKKLASRKLQDGDLVLEVSGGSKDQPTGRSLYLTNGILSQFDCPMEPASFCRLLRPESKNISVVLAQHMTYIYAQGKTWEYQNQSTGISNFQTTHFLESELVVVPSDEVLKVFAENVRPMIDRAHLTQISKLTALRDTLLPRLISGQLRLPEAEQAIAAITD